MKFADSIAIALLVVMTTAQAQERSPPTSSPQVNPGKQTRRDRAQITEPDLAAIQERIQQNWSVAIGTKKAGIVEIHVERMNPDGTIPPDAVRIVKDGGHRTHAAAAVRAIYRSQPWPVPGGGWPEQPVILRFDLRGIQ